MASDTAPSSSAIPLKIEFSGGLELLFSNVRSHQISIPAQVPSSDQEEKPADISYLLQYLRDNLLRERAELFMEGNTTRPGILVLVNDVDWELEGEGDYQLQPNDEIVFISTLHGG